jgi:prefoldin alpha subunit
MAEQRGAPITEQQVQEDLQRLDAYRNQLSAMVQQLQYLQASRADHLRARESLEGLERIGGRGELLIPIGGEAFLRGTPEADAKVLIGMGSGVVVELDRPKVVEMLAERLTKIEEASQELEGQVRTLDERVQQLSRRLEAITQDPGDAGLSAPDDVGRD